MPPSLVVGYNYKMTILDITSTYACTWENVYKIVPLVVAEYD